MRTPAGRQVKPLESTGTIFGDHFDQDDAYRLRRPHGMKDWLLVYTLHGEGYVRTPAGEKRCGPGQLGLLRANIAHEYGTVKGKRWNFLWIHYPGLPENRMLRYEEFLVETLPDERVRGRVEQAFRNVLQDSLDRLDLWEALCENSLREILLLLAQRMNKRLDPRVEQTLGLLSRSLKEDIRIDEISREIGISGSRLAHLFKQETGYTIVEHLNQMRVRHAALLMTHSGRTANEAALDVGFNSYNHFADQFRKQYGVSPRQYRQACKPT
ncbi:helix-turn-helix domain-containing protein [Paenibacillus sp. FSL W7-1332]|uniref:helix-turn-helix domain-containing protein n=1 Tax=Paenibacillus sp. FSL W7-1332 TaxID=2921702 RepID=UPI0030CBBC2F